MYPFVWHSLALSLFSSVIGPFGGFFASGFKRAFKIKDFGDIIPGHGGIMDRFDCQYLMATFVNVYITSFIRAPNPQKLFQQFALLTPNEMVSLYHSIQSHLRAEGLLDQLPIPGNETVIAGWEQRQDFFYRALFDLQTITSLTVQHLLLLTNIGLTLITVDPQTVFYALLANQSPVSNQASLISCQILTQNNTNNYFASKVGSYGQKTVKELSRRDWHWLICLPLFISLVTLSWRLFTQIYDKSFQHQDMTTLE